MRTTLGGSQAGGTLLQFPATVVTDPVGNAYVVGHSNATNYPTVNSPLTTPPFNSTQHAFVLKLPPQADVKLTLTGIESIVRSGGALTLSAVLTNRGTDDGDEIQLTSAKVGTPNAPGLPLTVGSLGVGQSVRVPLRFPDDSSIAGTVKTLVLTGRFAGGTYSVNRRFTLP